MQIELNKNQFRELLIGAMLYSWIYGGLADTKGEDSSKFEKVEKILLQIAKREKLLELYEEFHNSLIPSDEVSEEVENIIGEYNDDNFWHELMVILGKRDFYRDMTKKEKEEAEKDNWLPQRVHEFYKKYDKEFEKYGIERLEVKSE